MTLILNYPNQTHSLLGDAVDGTNGEERHESEDAAVSAYATAAVTENVIVSFPATYRNFQPTFNLEIDWGEDDPSTTTNHTENDKEMIKRKISTDVNQARITNYFTAKKPRQLPKLWKFLLCLKPLRRILR